MANNYSSMAEEFEFPKAAAEDFMKMAKAMADGDDDKFPSWVTQEQKDELGEYMQYYCLGEMEYSDKSGTLYISEEQNADIDATGTALSMVMKHHGVNDVIALHAAFECSKPRPGEFGGAMCAVGPEGVRFLDENAFLKAVRGELLGEAKPESEWKSRERELWEMSEKFNDMTGYEFQMHLASDLKEPCAYIDNDGECVAVGPGGNGKWSVWTVTSPELLMISDEINLVEGNLPFDEAMAKFFEKADCDVTLDQLRKDGNEQRL